MKKTTEKCILRGNFAKKTLTKSGCIDEGLEITLSFSRALYEVEVEPFIVFFASRFSVNSFDIVGLDEGTTSIELISWSSSSILLTKFVCWFLNDRGGGNVFWTSPNVNSEYNTGWPARVGETDLEIVLSENRLKFQGQKHQLPDKIEKWPPIKKQG